MKGFTRALAAVPTTESSETEASGMATGGSPHPVGDPRTRAYGHPRLNRPAHLDLVPPRPKASPDVLNGWKEIAAYLGKAVRTAQRWEEELGLPVRRAPGPRGDLVAASRAEIDRWMAERTSRTDAKRVPIYVRETPVQPGTVEATTDTAVPVAPAPAVGGAWPPTGLLQSRTALWVALASVVATLAAVSAMLLP